MSDTCSCPSCEQTPANRRLAMAVGYAGLFIALLAMTASFVAAKRKDAINAAKLAAMTDEQLAEDAIDDSLEFGRAIVSAEGNIVKFNAALRKWTHWEDAVGKPLATLVPEELRDTHVKMFNEAIARVEAGEKYKTKAVECVLPRIDDPSKVTHVTIITNVIKPKAEGARPFVAALVLKTSSLEKVNVLGGPKP